MRNRRRRFLRAGLITTALAFAGAVTLFVIWNSQHRKLLDVGSDIDSFLATYSKDFKSMSQSLLLTSYGEGSNVNFFSQLGEPENIAGARKISFLSAPSGARATVPEQLRSYFDPVEKIDNAKFKLNRLYDFSEGESATIRIRFQVWGLLKTGEGFYDSGLVAATLGKDEEGSWEIKSQDVENAYRVTRPPNTYFTDVTAESGLDSKLGSIRELDEMFAGFKFSVHSRLARGMAVADVNGDGSLDILLSGVKRAALYINDGKGHFTDAGVEWGLSPDQSSFSIFPLFVDFDNDGAVDLLLLRQFNESKVFRNEGGRFKDVSGASGLQISQHAMTACAADYDNDGNIDLFIGSYGKTMDDVPETVVRSRNGQPSHLYRNRGDLTFEDVTNQAGIDHTGWALASAFYDLNDDGRPDIYVANDFGYNCFYSNNGDGTFTDDTWNTGTHDIGSSMNVSLLDYDGDGRLDIYTSGIASNTVWFQGPGMNYILSRFLTTPSTCGQTCATFLDLGANVSLAELNRIGYKVNNGNSLMRNLGGGKYAHVENEAGCAWAEWAWGAAPGDFDCDGNEDIFAANGFITTPDTKDF
jgi:hypothetical protein